MYCVSQKCISDCLIPTIIHVSGNDQEILKVLYLSKEKIIKGYIHVNKRICSLTIDLSIVDCFIILSLKMAKISNFNDERKT
jgi:hypothetical protein